MDISVSRKSKFNVDPLIQFTKQLIDQQLLSKQQNPFLSMIFISLIANKSQLIFREKEKFHKFYSNFFFGKQK